jgi:anti-sigma factor RsiW
MKNSKNRSKDNTKLRRSVPCTSPALGAQVPDYIVERLDDEEAEVIENHLLDCKHCRATYLAIIRIRETGRRRLAADQSEQGALSEAEPRGLIDQEA